MPLGNVTFSDDVKPDFGLPWVPLVPKEELMTWEPDRLAAYVQARKQAEENALNNPVGAGWTLPTWELVMKNWDKYPIIIILGGNRSTKSTLAARLCVWAAGTIPEADIRCYHVNEDRSIQDQQMLVYDSLPAQIKAIPTKKGPNHSLQYSQKNGFTDNICILPPAPGARKGGSGKVWQLPPIPAGRPSSRRL